MPLGARRVGKTLIGGNVLFLVLVLGNTLDL